MNGVRASTIAATAAMLLALSACAARPGIVPLCEGVAYVAQADHLVGVAIDALARNDVQLRDDQLSRARSSLDEARGRLGEAQQDKTGDWTDESQLFGQAIELTSGTIEQVSTAIAGDMGSLRASLSKAESALTQLGPPSGCIPDPSYWVSAS